LKFYEFLLDKYCHKFCEKDFKRRAFEIFHNEKETAEFEYDKQRSWKKVLQVFGKINSFVEKSQHILPHIYGTKEILIFRFPL
jgi:hypothetical protein